MIDLERAAQAAESLGWDVSVAYPGDEGDLGFVEVYIRDSEVTIWGDRSVTIDESRDAIPLHLLAPLIAAWSALAAGGTDGY